MTPTPHKRHRKGDNDVEDIDLPEDEIRRVLEAPPDTLDKDLRNKLELLLLEFLEKVCSNGTNDQVEALQFVSPRLAHHG